MTFRAEAGLTLVELLIALALLGFALLAIAPLFLASVRSNYSANEYTSIHVLARDRLEQLMNLPFDDPQLAAGVHANDLPATLPNPVADPHPANVRNPFEVSYQVLQYRIPPADAGSVPPNSPFTPIRVTAAGQPYQYKRIDVTVTSGTGLLGIGQRFSRVSGCVSNPFPNADLSVADPSS